MAAVAYPSRTGPAPCRPRPALRLLPFTERPVLAPPPAAPSRLRAVAVIALVLLVGGLLAGRLVGASLATHGPAGTAVVSPPSPVPAPVHVVQPGETLWSIARAAQPEGDIRPLVAHWAARHGGTILRPGERLDLS